MTDSAEKPTVQPIPTVVDVTPQPGRRVRTPDGSLLPADHVLRGEPRSPYWIRAELDGDVKLTPHDPSAVAAAPAAPAEAAPPPPAAEAPSEKPGRSKT